MKTYYWDFYGPRAEGTARHFVVHLNQFLRQQGIEGCETGHVAPQPGHVAAWCKTPPASEQAVVTALRPKRSDEALPGANPS